MTEEEMQEQVTLFTGPTVDVAPAGKPMREILNLRDLAQGGIVPDDTIRVAVNIGRDRDRRERMVNTVAGTIDALDLYELCSATVAGIDEGAARLARFIAATADALSGYVSTGDLPHVKRDVDEPDDEEPAGAEWFKG